MCLTSPAASSEPLRQQPWNHPQPVKSPESVSLLSPARGHLGGEPASPAVFCCPRGSSAHIAAPPHPAPAPAAPSPAPFLVESRGASRAFSCQEEGQGGKGRQLAGLGLDQGRHRAGFRPSSAGGGKEGEEQEPPALERVLTGARVSPPLWKGHHRSSILPSFLPTGRYHS